jgi:hypothetical protein
VAIVEEYDMRKLLIFKCYHVDFNKIKCFFSIVGGEA